MAPHRWLERVPFFAVLALVCTSAASARPPEACAAVSVVTSPAVTAGYSVGIHGSVGNCSETRQRYTLVVSVVSDCGLKEEIAAFRLAFRPGENRLYGVSYATAPEVCTGPATISVDVLDGDAILANASATLTVTS